MSQSETSAARVAAARAVLRLLARLARRPSSGPQTSEPHAASKRPTAIDAEALKLALRRGWIEKAAPAGDATSTEPWTLSHRGREFLKRAMSGQDLEAASAAVGAAVRGGNQPASVTTTTNNTAPANPTVNHAESPLAWMRSRKGRDGLPLGSDQALHAGERLRADFFFAGMTPRVTANWSAVPGGSSRSPAGAGVELRDGVAAAQERVRRALAAVGPELSGVLVDVCCHLKGIEDAERAAGWPQRSGKVVLQLALASLARHYGLDAGPRRSRGAHADGGIRHWGADDYRPGIDAWKD